jgi:bifunctional pyridoxal-dependent enzyme with beta-cystathionase and maltose regulon repressor activities
MFVKSIAAGMLQNSDVFLHKRKLEQRMRAFCNALKRHKIAYVVPDTGVNVFIHQRLGDDTLRDRLAESGLLVKSGADFGPHHRGYVRAVIAKSPAVLAQAAAIIAHCF